MRYWQILDTAGGNIKLKIQHWLYEKAPSDIQMINCRCSGINWNIFPVFSGAVVTLECVEKLIRKDMTDPLTGDKLSDKDIIPLQRVCTDFMLKDFMSFQ